MTARVLVVAGSDSGGGAGIQADIKTVTALGGYAMTAVTAITAQNTLGVKEVVGLDADFVATQMTVVLEDLGADAMKTGMLHTAAIVERVAEVVSEQARGTPLVVDPVMVAKGGAPLLEDSARDALVSRLVPLASLLTPNIPEAEALVGHPIENVEDMRRAADKLVLRGPGAVLVKGGHLDGDRVVDLLVTADGAEHSIEGPRIDTRSNHGTGCTLASAIATGLAEGLNLRDSVERARAYLRKALRTAPGLGKGHGPLNHAHTFTLGG